MSSPNGFTVAAVAPSAGGGQPTVVHAYLDLREPPKGKVDLKPGASIGTIPFQFNPKDLTITKSASWARKAQKGGKKSAVPQYGGADPSKLALEMFLDASARQDDYVVATVEKLLACCVPTDASHQNHKGSPPWVVFHWGGLTSFTGYIKSVSVKYTLFTPAGLPIRATATVNLEEIAGEHAGQNPTSGAIDARSVHVVAAGDSLPSIAWREYGDPTVWRVIAEANDVDDPLRLRPGTRLLLPALDQAAR